MFPVGVNSPEENGNQSESEEDYSINDQVKTTTKLPMLNPKDAESRLESITSENLKSLNQVSEQESSSEFESERLTTPDKS